MSQEPLLTVSDYLHISDESHRHELSAGLLLSEPLPTHHHDRTMRRLLRLLEAFVESKRLGEVFAEAGYLLARNPDTVRGPDLSFVSKERLEGFEATRFFDGAPDLAVEILSPSNRPGQMHGKVADYFAAGARLVWLVDPASRTVSVYREVLTPRRLSAGDALDGGDVLPGLSIPIDAIFTR